LSIQINAAYSEDTKSKYGYARDMVYITGGGTYYSYEGLSAFMLGRIYGKVPQINGYKAIIGTGYRTVLLNKPISAQFRWFTGQALDELTDDDDLDKDGLYDYQEILFITSNDPSGKWLINFDNNGDVQLCTFGEIKNRVGESLFYVERGLNRYRSATGDYTKSVVSLNSARILPIKSDPTSVDGDGDGIFDKYDFKPLRTEYFPDKFIENINSGIMNHKLIKVYNHELLYVYEGELSNDIIYSITGHTVTYGINTRYLLYAFKYDNDEYIYKISDSNLSEKELENRYSYIYKILYMKYLVDEIRKDTAQEYGTISFGFAGSVTPTAVDFSGEFAISFDKKGNIAFQTTVSDGITMTAAPGASIGGQITYTNAPDVKYLNGYSTSVSASAIGELIGAGYDVVIFDDFEGNTYMGGSLSILAGTPGAEAHVNFNQTDTIYIWNIFDELDKKCDILLQSLME